MSFYYLQGYYNDAEATKSAVDAEGFYLTGDVGYFDEKGALFVVDRKKEIMKVYGQSFNPSEIENIIEEVEGVELVAVVGIPDDMIGNYVTAAVVKRAGFESLTERTIIDHVASKLADHKHLRGGVYFFDKLLMTGSGKVLKRFVKENIIKIKTG